MTLTLLGRGATLPPIEELYELTGHDRIESRTLDERVHSYIVAWPDVEVTLVLLDEKQAARALAGAVAFARGRLAQRADAKARRNLRRVEQCDTAAEVTITPAPDAAGKARDLVLGVLAWYEDALLWADGALYNEEGKRFIGAEDARPRYFVDVTPEDSAESVERRSRSLAVLRREKIPFIEHLAVVIDSAQAAVPAPPQIVERMLALLAVAERAEGGALADYEARLSAQGIAHAATPDERAFAAEQQPIQQDTIKFSQRVESAWVLAWALGLVDALRRPDDFCDVEALRALAAQPIPSLLKRVRPQPTSDLLDALDLHYRYHWAVNDAELYGTRIPGQLIPAVAYERHYALNWLATGIPWDQVPTDT